MPQPTAEVYLIAFQSLFKAEKREVFARLLEDKNLREDILDIAVIRQREREPSRPFEDYVPVRKARNLSLS